MYNIKDLTLEEKLLLLTGKNEWATNDLDGKLPSVIMSDGPNGVRKCSSGDDALSATAMPTLSVVCNTWNKELSYLDGESIADECIEKDIDLLLAPGINIKRDVLNGRNFEYFSEDPFLTGTMARAFVQGVQDKGVGTCVKHFCLNNSDHDRHCANSEVDERTLREVYTFAFEEVIKAKPWTVMCSYNPINGVHASANEKMLKTTLREKLGFDGAVISDWGAVHNHPQAVKATCDLRMPYAKSAFNTLKNAYEKGIITEQEIDVCAQNILDLINKKVSAKKALPIGADARHKNAVKIAEEGIVLLKNEDGILPLKKGKVAIMGEYQNHPPLSGGGSANVKTDYAQQPLSTLIEQNSDCKTITGRALATTVNPWQATLWRNHFRTIYDSDATLICVGERTPEVSEGWNRESIKLSAQQEQFIINACEYSKNIVVIVYAGSVIDMSAWIDKVKAVVFVGYAGQGVNQALANILTGKISPSGKLSETFPLSIENTVTKGEFNDGRIWYKEGVFVGYRHYEKEKLPVLFPFGHGLSYGEFRYSDIKVEKKGEVDYVISYLITNLSNQDAKEISQVYIKHVSPMAVRPEKELKGYSKDLIKAGESKRVSIDLDFKSFAYYSTVFDRFVVEDGVYEVMVGASSRDIRLREKIHVAANDIPEEGIEIW